MVTNPNIIKRLNELEDEVKDLRKKHYQLSLFIKDLATGHKSERRHKKVFDKFFNRLQRYYKNQLNFEVKD